MTKEANSKLFGRWRSETVDPDTSNSIGEVILEFGEDGRLTYVVVEGDKRKMIFLRYEIEGDMIVTNQVSNPREERSKYNLVGDNRLEIEFEGVRSSFLRETD